jgi:hypothetical protein
MIALNKPLGRNGFTATFWGGRGRHFVAPSPPLVLS